MGFKREVKVTPSLFFFFIFCFFCGCLALFNGLWFLAVYYHFETTLVFLAPPVFEEIRDISWIGYMGLDIYRESLLTSYASSFNNNLAVVVWDMAPVEFDLQLVDFYMLNFTSDFIEFDFLGADTTNHLTGKFDVKMRYNDLLFSQGIYTSDTSSETLQIHLFRQGGIRIY